MKNVNQNSFSPGIVLILVGVLTYIAVDSGFIHWVKPTLFDTSVSKENHPAPQSLAEYSGKIQTELKQVETAVQAHKSQLVDMQKQMSDYEKSLAVQRSNLRELDENIRNLRKLEREENSTATYRTPANSRIFSIGDVEGQIRAAGIDATIEPVTLSAQNFMRLNSVVRFDSERTMYLARAGLIQVRSFVQGMASLGYDRITLAYSDRSDEENLQRLDVLKRFISQIGKDRVRVTLRSIKNDDGVQVSEVPELWASKMEQP